jgi:hypothetical protein
MTSSKARRAKRPQGSQGVFQGTVLKKNRGGTSLASGFYVYIWNITMLQLAKSSFLMDISTISMAMFNSKLLKSTISMANFNSKLLKSTISMAMFNSFFYVYQAGYLIYG